MFNLEADSRPPEVFHVQVACPNPSCSSGGKLQKFELVDDREIRGRSRTLYDFRICSWCHIGFTIEFDVQNRMVTAVY